MGQIEYQYGLWNHALHVHLYEVHQKPDSAPLYLL